jgi:hypothetical protein
MTNFLNHNWEPPTPYYYRKHDRGCETDFESLVDSQESPMPLERCFMFLELYSVQDSIDFPNQERDPVEYFGGKGHYESGTLTLKGTCNTSTGVVVLKITTTGGGFEEWQGMVSPFGMAGVWGLQSCNGWWWIWPREWSDYPATTGSD